MMPQSARIKSSPYCRIAIPHSLRYNKYVQYQKLPEAIKVSRVSQRLKAVLAFGRFFLFLGKKLDERATKHLRKSLQVLFYIDPGHGRGPPVLRCAPERADHIDISNEKE